MTEKWKIRVQGYGTFDFTGTEAEAEEMRIHKARWEGGVGLKYRTENQTEVDQITAQMCNLFDLHKGVPMAMSKRLKEAKQKLAAQL